MYLFTPLAFTTLLLPRRMGFLWDYLRQILPGCQRITNVPNGIDVSL